SAGVPSWIAAPGTGTVTSATIAAGSGINVTGTCTITTLGTCTIAVNEAVLTNSLGANVLLNNTANFFDGPSVAQGTSGTWWASGTVTLTDSATVADFVCKLWDGTTVISAATSTSESATHFASISLSGYLASPAANIKMSCRDLTAATGSMPFNSTGTSKDSTISVHRI